MKQTKQSFIDNSIHSSTTLVPVLRFGSAGNTIIFTGPIKDIGLKTISLPENDVVKTKNDAYHITGTMYLTKSGLIVNIGEDFASKFDGSVYTSTKLIASELGKLAVEKNLTGVNENGETIYVDKDNHIYVLTIDNVFYCEETGHTMTEAETLEILYEVPPMKNQNGPVIEILGGQEIMLERLTDHIAHDINKISSTGDWRYNGTFYYSVDGETNWTAIEKKNISVSNGVITVKYYDSNAQKNVEIRIYKKADPDFVSRSRSTSDITYIEFPTFDKNGNASYVVAGSDGSVAMLGAPATQKIETAEDGTDYEVMDITAGQDVEVRVNDPKGSLLNGKSDPHASNVIAGGKATVIAAGGAGSIGTQSKPLNIEAEQIEFLNQDGEQVIAKDTYVYVDEGDTSLDGDIIVDGVIWELKTADGSVTASDKNLIVKNGGTATIMTNVAEGAISAGNVALKTITVEKSLENKQSTLTMDVAGDVAAGKLTVAGSSLVDIDADGTVSILKTATESGDLTVTGGSTLDVNANSGINVGGNQTVKDSKLTETSGNGPIAATGNEQITDSVVTKNAKGDITVGGNQTVADSILTETSTAGAIAVTGNEQITEDSTVTKTAKEDITVGGDQTVTGSKLAETSTAGAIGVTGHVVITDSEVEKTGYSGITVGGNQTVKDSELTETSGNGPIAVTGNEQITNSVVTKNANGDITVGGSQMVTGSELSETSSTGAIAVTGNEQITGQSKVTKNANGNITVGGSQMVTGSELSETSSTGAIAVTGDEEITGQSTVTKQANGDISVGGSQTVTGSELSETSTAGAIAVTGDEKITGQSTVTKQANGDISVGGSQTVTGSKLTEASAKGAISVNGDERITDSEVTKTAGGNITVSGDQTVTGSRLTETSTNGDISVTGNATLTNSATRLTANKNLSVTGNTVVTGGTLSARATTGDITLTKIRTMNTTTGFTAGGDMRFDDWMSEKSYNTVAVGGTFGMRENGGTSFEDYEKGYGNRSFIKYAAGDTNANALLSVSAGNVGEADNRLVVDIPAALTMKMPNVGNAYIDALELILADSTSFDSETGKYNETWLSSENNLLTGYFVTTVDNPKINEFLARDPATGKENLQGDKLNHIADKNVQTEFEIPEAEALADRFVNGTNTLNSVLDKTVVMGMLGNELTGKVLAEIISDEKREELLNSLGMLEGLTDKQKENLLAPAKAESVIASILKNSENADSVYSAMMGTDVNGQKKLFALLLDTQLSGQVEGSPFVNLDQLVNDLLTDEEREALYQQAIRENGIPAEADIVPTGDTDPRAFNVEIGVSTGNTTIYNDGDINLTVTGDSDLTAENIKSERGDVNIDVQDGSILSAGSGANITGENVNLRASENIGTQDSPVNVEQVEEEPGVTVTLTSDNGVYRKTAIDAGGNKTTVWVMDVDLSYDWARLDDLAATKRLDAVAQGKNGTDGNIFLAEQTGNTGLGILDGAGMVSILTPGNVTDVRTDAEKAAGTPNITAENAIVISEDGYIGTEDAPIVVLIDNHMTASAESDVNVSTTENLSITADSQTGKLNIAGDKNLTVDNTVSSAGGTGDMSIGNIVAGGNVSVNAKGDMQAADDSSLVSGDNIALNAGGSIGTAEQPLRLDTAAGDTGSGSLKAIGGGNVTVEEIDGDLAIDSVVSGGNTNITADGGITDTNDDAIADAADSQKKADDAKNLADAAQSEADVLDEYAAGIEKVAADKENLAKEAAERAEEIRQKIDDALAKNPDANVNALLNQLKLAQAAADKAQEIADQAKAEAEAQRAIADEAAKKAQMLNDAAKAAQDAADAALEKANAEDPSIKTGGDLNLIAGGAIGTGSNALDTEVGGKTNVSAEGDVNLSERGDMHIGTITNPEDAKLALDSTGGIISDSVISGDNLDINALGGDVQVETDVNSISGTVSGDAQISNSGDLRVDDLTVKGQLDLSADGAITAGTKADGTANITAGNLIITVPANKDIGTEVNPLIVDTDRITADGRDIYINFLKDVTIDHIRGQHVELEVNGDIFAGEGRPEHIWANSLDMDVLGNIGTAKKPLLIHVPGKVVISTEYGSAYVRNLYQLETAEVAEKYGFGRIVSDADFRFVPYAFMTLRPVELHDSILTLKEVGGSRMVAIRGSGLDAVQGNVLYIWALDEDGVSVTNELRHLHLNAGTVRMMIALGYEWLMFQTGDSVVMIHLTELENGSYIITVDPQNADCTVSVSLDGEERNQLPDAMLVAEITDVPETV